jgi:hypothetical protein
MISLRKLLNYRSVADRGAAYLTGTSRSVGRGWPVWPLPTRFKEGYAYVLSVGPNVRYRKLLLDYQREAMKNNKGIWKVILNETTPYYIGNKRSKVFHRPKCPFGSRTSPFNLIKFRSKWNAFYEGYRPCKKCLP